MTGVQTCALPISYDDIVFREFSSGYISRGTWEDNIVVGASRTLSRFTTLGVDAGYVKGTVLGRLTSYHGYFASTELRRRLSNNFSISATYRLYNHSVSQEAVRRNAVLLTLIWNPSRHEVQRNDAKHTGTLERSEQ